MQCLKKLCHDFHHEIGFRLMSVVFSTIIFCHQIGKFLVICIIFTCLHLDLPYAHGQCESRNVVAYQAIIEPYLLAWPKIDLNNQKSENLFYEYPAFDT